MSHHVPNGHRWVLDQVIVLRFWFLGKEIRRLHRFRHDEVGQEEEEHAIRDANQGFARQGGYQDH